MPAKDKRPVCSEVYEALRKQRHPDATGVSEEDLKRFAQKVMVLPDGCWQWIGSLDEDGYGQFKWGRRRRAYRVAYEWTIGIIPQELEAEQSPHSVIGG